MSITRRALITSAASTASLSMCWPAAAANPPPVTTLQLQRRSLDVNGKSATVFGIRQPNGTFGLTTNVGATFRVRVENQIDAPSLIHWHGLTPPWQQDGVPGISGPPIPPGKSAEYDFPLRFGGTFWMHSHEGFQEQLQMTAPLIIHDGRARPGEQEIVLMLADFSFTRPEEIYASLRRPSTGKSMSAVSMKAPSGPDLNDVTYDAFLANDRTLADPEIITVAPGRTVFLRVINGSSMSNFHLDLGGLQGELIAVDGFCIVPVPAGRRLPIAVAQRLDIRLSIPPGTGAHPILAVLEGTARQTGVILTAGKPNIPASPTWRRAHPPH